MPPTIRSEIARMTADCDCMYCACGLPAQKQYCLSRTRREDGRGYADDADFLCVYCKVVPVSHNGACRACSKIEQSVT